MTGIAGLSGYGPKMRVKPNVGLQKQSVVVNTVAKVGANTETMYGCVRGVGYIVLVGRCANVVGIGVGSNMGGDFAIERA